MEFEEKKKEKMNRKDHWLHKDIVVKVVSKKLGDKYYKKKAYVKVFNLWSDSLSWKDFKTIGC